MNKEACKLVIHYDDLKEKTPKSALELYMNLSGINGDVGKLTEECFPDYDYPTRWKTKIEGREIEILQGVKKYFILERRTDDLCDK